LNWTMIKRDLTQPKNRVKHLLLNNAVFSGREGINERLHD